MTRPTDKQLKEWREQAENTTMISAVGEYTPKEFTVLLDEVDILRAQRNELLAALEEARSFIEGYVDVVDGDYGQPAPNKAMRTMQTIDGAIQKAEGKS